MATTATMSLEDHIADVAQKRRACAASYERLEEARDAHQAAEEAMHAAETAMGAAISARIGVGRDGKDL